MKYNFIFRSQKNYLIKKNIWKISKFIGFKAWKSRGDINIDDKIAIILLRLKKIAQISKILINISYFRLA